MAAAGKLSERTPEASDGVPPEDSLAGTGLKYIRGAAHIYEDLELDKREDNYKALEQYEQLFKSIGLDTESRFSCKQGITSSMISDTKDQRRLSVFLIIAGDRHDPNDPNELVTTLYHVLQAISEKYHLDTPKLLIFCRLIDPGDPLFDVATKEASDIKSRSEEDWKRNHPNVALIYKRGDCNNMSSFLNNLKDEIEHRDDPDNPGKCAPVEYIVKKLTPNNTKKDFFHKGLSDNSDLRIEAFRFEDKLLKNDPMFKDKPRFSPLPVSDMDACYENTGDGKVLIISNERFDRQSRRRGTRIDCENLAHLFHRLGFAEASINVKHDLKASDMRKAVEEDFSQECGSCAVVAILTHGSENRLYGVEEETSENPNWIAVEEVISMLSASSGLSNVVTQTKPEGLRVHEES
uniref:CASPASE_P20 domain-containing protein n=1 Tax=Macrostomum lignano TaxID=282301 RepID=A0A1I8I2Z6_9PLAT